MKRQSGFTLIELMTVIAIITILVAVFTPNIFRWVSTQRFNSAVRGIQASIMQMRLDALKENVPATITFNAGAGTYQTDEWKNGHDSVETHTLPAGIIVLSSITNAPLTFNARGMAINGNGQPTTGQITIKGPGGKLLNISVSITGNARITG